MIVVLAICLVRGGGYSYSEVDNNKAKATTIDATKLIEEAEFFKDGFGDIKNLLQENSTISSNLTIDNVNNKISSLTVNDIVLNNSTLNINDTKIKIPSSFALGNINANDTSNISMSNSKLFLVDQFENKGTLGINLKKLSIMHIFGAEFKNQTTTNINLDNSALMHYNITDTTNISSVNLSNHSLLAGTYNIDKLVANDSVFGVGATQNTYLGAIKANSASGTNNAIWLMGTKLEGNTLVVNTKIRGDGLVNLPLVIIKGDVPTNFIAGAIAGEQGWTNVYMSNDDFKRYIKKYEVISSDKKTTYTIYSLNTDNDGTTYANGVTFIIDKEKGFSLKGGLDIKAYSNNTNDDTSAVIDGNGYGNSMNMLDETLESDKGDYTDTKLKYVGTTTSNTPSSDITPPTIVISTDNKIKPEVIKAASDYASFYNYAIRDNILTDKVNQDGIWLDARVDFANNARKDTFKAGMNRVQESGNFDFYLGVFAQFSSSSLDTIGARVEKYGTGIYGGWLFFNGAFVNYEAKIYNIQSYINNDILKELNNNKTGFDVNYELGYAFRFDEFSIIPSLQQFITLAPNFTLANQDGEIQTFQKVLFSNKFNTSFKYLLNDYLDLSLDIGYAFDMSQKPEFVISSNGDELKLEKDKKSNYFYTKLKSQANVTKRFAIDFECAKDFGKGYDLGYSLRTVFKYAI